MVQLMGPTMRGMPSLGLSNGTALSAPARGYSKDGDKKTEKGLKKAEDDMVDDDDLQVPESLAEEFRIFKETGLLSFEQGDNLNEALVLRRMQREFDPDRHLDSDYQRMKRRKVLGEEYEEEEEENGEGNFEEEDDDEGYLLEDEALEKDNDENKKEGEEEDSKEGSVPDLSVEDTTFLKGLPKLEQVLSTTDPTASLVESAQKVSNEEQQQDFEQDENDDDDDVDNDSILPDEDQPLDEEEINYWKEREKGRNTILPDSFYRKSLVQADEQKVLDAAFMFTSLDTLDAVTENYEAKVKQQKAHKQVDAGKHFAETLKQRNQFDAQKIFLPDLSAQELQKRKELVEQFVQETAKTSTNVSAAELNAFKQDLSNKILQAGADPVLILNNAKEQNSERPFALECISELLTNKDKLREIFDASTLRPRDLDFETYAASVKANLEPSLRQMIFGFEANEDPSNPPVSGSVKGLTLADSFNTRRLFEALNPNMISLLQHYDAYPKQVKNWVKLFFTPRGVWNEEGRWEPVSGYRTLLTEDSRNLIDNVSFATSSGLKNHKEATTQSTGKAAVVENDELYQTFDESFDIFAGNQEESRKSKTTLPKPKPIPADLVGQFRFGFTAEEVAPLPEKMKKLLTFAYASPREIKKHRIQAAREKWEQGPKDTGSPAAQVAMMTERLNAIAEHIRMFPRDLVAKRQNVLLANKRKTVLKYLKRENITLYYSVIDSLSLRDVQALKPRNRR